MKAESLDSGAYLSALAQNEPGEPFTMREQSGLAYARKLTDTPGQMDVQDIHMLRQADFDDGEILELNQVAAYFAYANRTVTGLGVNTDNEILGQSPATGGNDSGWSHG